MTNSNQPDQPLDATAPPPPTLAAALPLVAERLRGLTVDISTARVERMDYEMPDAGGWCWAVTVEVCGRKTE